MIDIVVDGLDQRDGLGLRSDLFAIFVVTLLALIPAERILYLPGVAARSRCVASLVTRHRRHANRPPIE